jgi:hypothetical protein
VTDFWRDIESLTVKHGSGVRLAEVDNSLSASLQRLAVIGSICNQKYFEQKQAFVRFPTYLYM